MGFKGWRRDRQLGGRVQLLQGFLSVDGELSTPHLQVCIDEMYTRTEADCSLGTARQPCSPSTTSGCSLLSTTTSLSRSSSQLVICVYNSHWPHWSGWSSGRNIDRWKDQLAKIMCKSRLSRWRDIADGSEPRSFQQLSAQLVILASRT